MKRMLALVLSCCLLGALLLPAAPAYADSPYALTEVSYDGRSVYGTVTLSPDAATLSMDDLCVRVAAFMEGGSYVYLFPEVYPNGSFSGDFVGPITYIAVTLFEKGVDWLEGGHALDYAEIFTM